MFPVALLNLLIILVVVGLVLGVVSQIPMDPTIARIIFAVVIVFVCIWLIYVLAGMLPAGGWFPGR